MNELAAAELYLSLAKVYGLEVDIQKAFDKVMILRKAQGEFQHHDAITGTEKQFVANDYNVQMEDGSFFANEATSTILGAMLDVNINRNITLKWNELTADKELGVIVVNNNAQAMKTILRMIVPVASVDVIDSKKTRLPFQINEIPDWSIERANGTHVVYVEVEVPAMGYNTLYVIPKPSLSTPIPRGIVSREEMIENKEYALYFENGLLATVHLKEEGRKVPLTDKLYHYWGRFGSGRSSGAYAFIPEPQTPDCIGESATLTILKGDLVDEARVVYREGYQQIIRLYHTECELGRVIEIVYDMGPTDDGREIVARFTSELLKSDRVIYTDANGLEDIKRVYREDEVEPVSANYYPITNRAWIQSEDNDLRMNVVVDRAHGVASVIDGVFEIMLKRRTRGDDWFGVDEPLKENDHYQQTMWLTLSSKKRAVAIHKRLDLMLNHIPLPFYFVADKVIEKSSASMLKKDLPANVQLLNFQMNQVADEDFLIRFHHIYTKGEDTELAEPVVFDINDYLNGMEIKEMKEMVLTGMFTREQVEKERMKWEIDPKMKQEQPAKKSYNSKTMVELTPMEFKTYRVKL